MLMSGIFAFNPLNVSDFGLTGVFLLIDGIVYWLVAKIFQLYVAVAGVQVSQDLYQQIASNFEVIVGVFALFYLAYALLKALINPDELQKNTPKTVSNLVTSLILLGVIPIIFTYMFKLQNVIINDNVIGNLMYGANSGENIETSGYSLTMTTLEAFLKIPDSVPGMKIQDQNGNGVVWGDLKRSINDGIIDNVRAITQWVEPVHGKTEGCDYIPIISTIVGGFLIYVMVSFTLDMGLRVAKLAFYQIISPIPILMRILPEKKSVFDNWVKGVIGTYLEVFIRLFIVQFCIFLVATITNSGVNFNETNGEIGTLGNIVVILGIMTFAKMAPKLISETLGIKGDMKLGIGGKLQAAGAFGLGAMTGAAALTGLRGITGGFAKSGNAWRNFRDNKSFGNFMGAVGSSILFGAGGVLSGATGGVSAAVRSAGGGFKAKTVKEMNEAAAKGIKGAAEASMKRSNYIASHGLSSVVDVQLDALKSMGRFAGIGSTLEGLKRESDLVGAISGSRKAMADAAETEINKKINKFQVQAADAKEGFRNLAELDNALERIRNSGSYTSSFGRVFAESDLVKLQQARSDLKDKMVENYLNGMDLDSTSAGYGSISKNNIAGSVREAISKYHTDLKNNIGAVARNLTSSDLSDPKVQAMRDNIESYLNDTRDMSIDQIMGNAAFDIGALAEDVKKYAGAAQANVNTKVNEFRQEEARRNGNS